MMVRLMDDIVRRDAPDPSDQPPMTPAEADRRSHAQAEAGLGIPLDEVERWVESWDTPAERPMPVARPAR